MKNSGDKLHIQRISSIKNYRIFQDFKAVTTAQPWQPVTVVYGSNGSGKSTLSSLFAELASGAASGTGISVELFRRQNVVQSISETDAVWSNLRVFNQDYVRDNLDFETAIDGSGVSAKHLLTLGGDRIKIEKRLKQIKSRQAEITEKLTEHGDSLRSVTKNATQSLLISPKVSAENLDMSILASIQGATKPLRCVSRSKRVNPY